MPLSGLHVYLAGPISGLSYEEATGWRDDASEYLADNGITALSPLRHKRYLETARSLQGHDHPLSSQRGIVTRDYLDVQRSDATLMNLSGASTVSIGTMFEAAWCYQLSKPLILVLGPDDKIHDHYFVKEAASYITDDIHEAMSLTVRTLTS